MKIDIVLAQLAELGGMDNVINVLCEGLIDYGFSIRIVQMVDCGLTWYNQGLNVVSLRNREEAATFRESIDDYAVFLDKNEKPDMIIATGWPIVTLITRKSIERIGLNIPILAWVHMSFREAAKCGVGDISCMAHADGALCISDEIHNDVREVFPKLKTYVVYNPVKHDNGSYKGKRFADQLAYVGRLVESKNLEMIFKAMILCRNEVTLTVVGAGELDKYVKMCDEYGLTNKVSFRGFSNEPWKLVDEAQLFIMPSKYEGFGLTIIEAMAEGMTVISTPVGIASTVIAPGETGYLIENDNEQMLAMVIDMLIDGKLPLIPSERCMELVEQFKPQEYIKKVLSAIMDVTS